MPENSLKLENSQLIYAGQNSIIYYQENKNFDTPILIKVLKEEYPSLKQIKQFYNEHDISQELTHIPGIRQVYQKGKVESKNALIMEYIPGNTVHEIWKEQKDLKNFLLTAITIASVLGELHKHHIIHKDINSNNIIINPADKAVYIIDLGISSKIDTRVKNLGNPETLEGTLPYISPEQTGRMNRIVDYRADLYSLGVTFYEMLTGKLPFDTDDPMELVHSHVARYPVPVHERTPSVPGIISDIIRKLMEKNAEDRYQTADGLKNDLLRCLREFEDGGCITPFDLGMQDFSPRFFIPQKLYGVDAEKTLLLDAFSRVAGRNCECVMVTGHSGVGKSSLIHEIHKPNTECRGYFISGKFDQYDQTLPYSAIIQAFSQLINLFLTEESDIISTIREQIQSRVGSNGRVLVDLIPNLELIIGPQPTVSHLGSIEAMNRFTLVCKNFLTAVCTTEHPITLFLDDLQWADHASLNLITSMLTDDDIRSFLLIGAYRDNEVDSSHPLVRTLTDIKEAGADISTITLYDLSQESVTSLVSDTLHSSLEHGFDLSELVYEKTRGNAFFVHQFLKYLYAEGLLTHDAERHQWLFDVNAIKKEQITENVVELMVGKIQKLSEDEKKILRLASCIGNHFSLQTLSAITDSTPAEIIRQLTPSLHEGFIIPMDENIPLVVHGEGTDTIPCELAFMHDRIQQAAYTLIPEEEKAIIHLEIGRILLLDPNNKHDENAIFQIASQLDKGLSLISEESERILVAELNLKAGVKAKNRAAYHNARDFLLAGMELLPPDSWDRMHDLTFRLYLNRAECEYALTNYTESTRLLDDAFLCAASITEQLQIYIQRTIHSTREGRYIDSINTGIKALKTINIILPPLEDNRKIEAYTKAEEQWFITAWQGKPIFDLITLPESDNPENHLLTFILANLIDASIAMAPVYLPVLTYTSVNLSIRYGNTPNSAYGYICHGMVLSSFRCLYEEAYEFSRVGLHLIDKNPDKMVSCKVLNLFGIIGYVKDQLANSPKYGDIAYLAGIESGDFTHACYGLQNGHRAMVSAGIPLPECYRKGEECLSIFKKFNVMSIYHGVIVSTGAIIRYLTGGTLSQDTFDSKEYTVTEYLQTNKLSIWGMFSSFYQIMGFYIMEKDHLALPLIEDFLLPYSEVCITRVEFRFYAALIYLRLYPEANSSEKEHYSGKIQEYLSFLRQIAHVAPYNFLSHVRLIEAELARIEERPFDAMKLYDQAINLAGEHNFIQYGAIANECAGKFWLTMEMPDIARSYLRKAIYCYDLWGASKKVEVMETKYPDIHDSKSPGPSHTMSSTSTSSSSDPLKNRSGHLDLSTIIKASRTLSEEIHLTELLQKMIRFVMENAGATKGILLTSEDGTLLVQATGETNPDTINTMLAIPVGEYPGIPHSIVNYTNRSRTQVILHNALEDEMYGKDPYLIRTKPKSVLCIPIENQGKLSGVLYLENSLTPGAFTEERVDLLRILSTHAAISIENAHLYNDLEEKVNERTSDLELALLRVKEQHEKLLTTQSQLVESEKMAGLGVMVAGVAHEINNPANYLYVSTKTLEKDITVFQTEIMRMIDESDSEVVQYLNTRFDTFQRSLKNINDGSNRIKNIVQDLRSVSRVNETEKEEIRVTEALDSTIRIVRAKYKSEIDFIPEYEDSPIISGYPAQLSQVFLNIMVNSCQAMMSRLKNTGDIEKGKLVVSLQDTGEEIKVSFQDNGCGMTQEAKMKIFEPFFTTKPIGEGTGLGMYISYGIVQKHNGRIEIESQIGVGTTFTVILPYVNGSFDQ